MADPFEYMPNRYCSRAEAIANWKEHKGAFPDGEYAKKKNELPPELEALVNDPESRGLVQFVVDMMFRWPRWR